MKKTLKAILNGKVVATRKTARDYKFVAVATGYVDAEKKAGEMDAQAERFEDPNDFTGWEEEIKAERAAQYRATAKAIRSGGPFARPLGWTSSESGVARLMKDAAELNLVIEIVPVSE